MRRQSIQIRASQCERRRTGSSSTGSYTNRKLSVQFSVRFNLSEREHRVLECACRKELGRIEQASLRSILGEKNEHETQGMTQEVAVVDTILRKVSSVDIDELKNTYKQTLLHHASGTPGNHDLVAYLLDTLNASPSVTDWTGRTPFHYACGQGLPETCQVLLDREKKANILNRTDGTNETPLHEAAANGNLNTVKLLCGYKETDVDKSDGYERTALQRATAYGHHKVVSFLLTQEEVDADTQDDDDLTPLHYVASPFLYPRAFRNRAEIARVLIRKGGADVDKQSEAWHDETPLHMAALEGNELVARILIEEGGADVNIPQKEGQTPLHYAASGDGNRSVVSMLLNEFGADPEFEDDIGRLPIHYAAENEQLGNARILLQGRSHTLTVQDMEGMTPVDIARQNNLQAMLSLFRKHSSS